MKRILLLVLIIVLGVPQIVPQIIYQDKPLSYYFSSPVEPNIAYLPAILDSTYYYTRDSDTSNWTLNDRRVFRYDRSGNLLTAEIPYYFPCDFRCQRNTIGEYIYNANGDLKQLIFSWWEHSTNGWERDEIRKYTYDESENVKGEIRYQCYFEPDTIIMGKSDSIVFKYNLKENITEIVHYIWDSEWEIHGREINKYDAKGNQTEHISYCWNSEIIDWEKEDQWVSKFDINGNETEHIKYRNSDSIGYRREVNIYDANGNRAESFEYSWKSDINDWESQRRLIYNYDIKGNLIESLIYYPRSGLIEWRLESRTVYLYDNNGNMDGKFDYDWDFEKDEWILKSRFEAYWSELATSLNIINENLKCLIYPNPTNNFLTVETDNLETLTTEIYSLNGNRLFYEEMEGPIFNIDLYSFQKGIYFIKIRSRDYVRMEKIIKL